MSCFSCGNLTRGCNVRSRGFVRFSQPLTDVLARLHQINSRAELVALGTYLRQRFGDNILAKVVVHDILQAGSKLIVIDGMRYQAEYTECTQLEDFQLLNITAPLNMRFERTRLRLEKADEQTMSYDEFTQREQDATEREIVDLQRLANHTIQNDGSPEELYRAVDQWFVTLQA